VAERTRGMGRGLAAILSTSQSGGEPELREIPVQLIAPNPSQPRRVFEEEPLVALAESLRERGVLQPVLVRPLPGGRYELIAGERRWRAAQLAGLESVPAMVRPDDDAASLELALIENMAREDLNPLEEARACAALIEDLGLTREEVGRRVGRSRVTISNLLRLLELPDLALMLLEDGSLSEGHGRALLMAPDHDARRRLAREAASKGWSVRQTEERARAAAGRDAEQFEPAATPGTAHPDQIEAAERLGEAFGRALGADVRVTPKAGGFRVQLAFDSLEEALAVAERLGVTAAV
jgi:ParB family transcriptional regulator, chromosome partitioning protein